jgi:ribonuclease T2
LRPSSFVICNTPVEVQFTSAGCLNYPCRTPDTVRKARTMVTIPSEYLDLATPLTVTSHEVIDNFVKANQNLSPADIEIDCDRTRLREVRICLSRDLHFRNCTGGSRSACRSEKVVMPPMRGL